MVGIITGMKEVILINYNMLNYFTYYLLIGLLFNLIVDLLSDHLETKNKFTIVEKIFVGLLWPWAAYKLVYEFFKAKQ